MKLLLESAMIFFGTLMAAGLVALGEPAGGNGTARKEPPTAQFMQLIQLVDRSIESGHPWPGQAAVPARLGR